MGRMPLACFIAIGTMLSLPPSASAQTMPPASPPTIAWSPAESPTPYQDDAWLAECRQRVLAVGQANPQQVVNTCAAWLRYYQAGGQPSPGSGYAMPVVLTQGTPICTPCPQTAVPRKPVRRRPVIRHRRAMHDKRIRLFPD